MNHRVVLPDEKHWAGWHVPDKQSHTLMTYFYRYLLSLLTLINIAG